MTTQRGERQHETMTIRAYLETLNAPKPRLSQEALVKRREELDAKLRGYEGPVIERLRLVQQRMNVDAALAAMEGTEAATELRQQFVKLAPDWCKRTGISREALREVGVPADVLREAGL